MITVRAAVADDAPAIAHLLAQLGYPTAASAIPPRLAALASEGSIALVAVDTDDRVLGLASAARHATLHSDPCTAYITALVTDESARRRGVGRHLVAALEQWARQNRCGRLSVTSAERRADAHAFYPSCGFPYSGRRFTKTLHSAAS